MTDTSGGGLGLNVIFYKKACNIPDQIHRIVRQTCNAYYVIISANPLKLLLMLKSPNPRDFSVLANVDLRLVQIRASA